MYHFLCHLRRSKSCDKHHDAQVKVTPLAKSARQSVVLNLKEKDLSDAKNEITKEIKLEFLEFSIPSTIYTKTLIGLCYDYTMLQGSRISTVIDTLEKTNQPHNQGNP